MHAQWHFASASERSQELPTARRTAAVSIANTTNRNCARDSPQVPTASIAEPGPSVYKALKNPRYDPTALGCRAMSKGLWLQIALP